MWSAGEEGRTFLSINQALYNNLELSIIIIIIIIYNSKDREKAHNREGWRNCSFMTKFSGNFKSLEQQRVYKTNANVISMTGIP